MFLFHSWRSTKFTVIIQTLKKYPHLLNHLERFYKLVTHEAFQIFLFWKLYSKPLIMDIDITDFKIMSKIHWVNCSFTSFIFNVYCSTSVNCLYNVSQTVEHFSAFYFNRTILPPPTLVYYTEGLLLNLQT